MKKINRSSKLATFIKNIRKMFVAAKTKHTHNKEVKNRFKNGTRKVVLFNKNPLKIKNNLLGCVTDVTLEDLAEYANYIDGKGATYIPSLETARARITPLKDNRISVEFFDKKGLPSYEFTITKTTVSDLYNKYMADKTLYIIEEKRGSIIRYFKKEIYAKKAILGIETGNCDYVTMRYKKFAIIPKRRSHHFGNGNIVKQKGFYITNTFAVSQTQFEYVVPKKKETAKEVSVTYALA